MIWECQNSDRFCEVSFSVLQKNQALKELNLSHNDFGVEGGQKLGPAIGEKKSQVREQVTDQ